MKKLLILAVALLLAAAAVSAQETPATQMADTSKAAAPAMKAADVQVELELGSGVTDRMPTGMADSFGADVGKVFTWCKVTGATDTTFVRHVYYFNGDEMGSVDLPVRSSSWRTWSSKNIMPGWVGDWEVKIFDANGNLLESKTFKITPAMTQEPMEQESDTGSATGQ